MIVVMSTPTIEARGLTKRFGDVTAVGGVDLTITPGEIVALLGPNGAGKTTTIDMLLGLTAPTSGTVSLFGGPPRTAVLEAKVGAMMQTGGLLRDVTVRDTLVMIAALQGARERVDHVLEQTDLVEIQRRRVSKCSGGEQQRIKFALALLTDPELLILDEPTAGMDVAARRDFWDVMRAEAAAGRTIIFATHYLEEAQEFAQRIILIGRGQLLADGPTGQIRSMTAGRTVSATLPGSGDSAGHLMRLREIPGVQDAGLHGHRAQFTSTDSDALARALLQAGATDLTITEPSLEDVFLTLTKDAR